MYASLDWDVLNARKASQYIGKTGVVWTQIILRNVNSCYISILPLLVFFHQGRNDVRRIRPPSVDLGIVICHLCCIQGTSGCRNIIDEDDIVTLIVRTACQWCQIGSTRIFRTHSRRVPQTHWSLFEESEDDSQCNEAYQYWHPQKIMLSLNYPVRTFALVSQGPTFQTSDLWVSLFSCSASKETSELTFVKVEISPILNPSNLFVQ